MCRFGLEQRLRSDSPRRIRRCGLRDLTGLVQLVGNFVPKNLGVGDLPTFDPNELTISQHVATEHGFPTLRGTRERNELIRCGDRLRQYGLNVDIRTLHVGQRRLPTCDKDIVQLVYGACHCCLPVRLQQRNDCGDNTANPHGVAPIVRAPPRRDTRASDCSRPAANLGAR